MIVVCPSCQARYKFDEAKLGDRARARTKCAKCGGNIDIENPLAGAGTLPPTVTPMAAPAPGRAAGTGSGGFRIDAGEPTTQRPRPAVEDPGSTMTGRDLHKAGLIELPKDKRFSLAVIQGAATGQIFPISKTRTSIGRSGQDVNLDDPEDGLLDVASGKPRHLEIPAALNNSFGFGGHNVALIFTRP